MNITLKRNGISAKFWTVHQHRLDWWVNAFLAGRKPPHLVMVPTEPLRAVSMGSPTAFDEVITTIVLLINETKRFDRSGLTERILVISPDDRSRPVIDEWEQKYRDKSVEDILWFPSFDNFEKVA